MRRIVLAAALLLTLAACREDFFDPTPGQTAAQPERVDFVAENVTILPGAANAVRIGFQPKDVSVHLRVERSSGQGRIVACPLAAIDAPLPAESACLPDLPSGVREGLTLTGLRAVALVLEGAPITLGIRMDFEASGRSIAIRLPVIARPAGASVCKDNACNPFFELTPVRTGAFAATAQWDGDDARLEMVEGRVLARAFSSTGIPYRVAGQASGGSGLSIAANLNAPSEYALALVNTGTNDLSAIRIEAIWP